MGGTGFDGARPVLLLLIAAAVLAGFAFLQPDILSSANLFSMAVFGVEIGLIALAQTFIICGGNTGIDISIGATAALSQVVLGRLMVLGLPWPIAIACALAIGIICGGVNALAINRFRIPAFIATLATLFAYSGLALVLTSGIDIDLSGASGWFLAIGQGRVLHLPFQLLLLYVPIFLIFVFLQHGTGFGRALYLVGTNDRAAALAGLRVEWIRGSTYLLAGMVAATAGIVNAARLGVARPDTLDDANLISIAAVVLGGTAIFGGVGSVVGTAIATVVIAIVDYGLSYSDFNSIYQAGIIGMILICTIFIEGIIRTLRRRGRLVA